MYTTRVTLNGLEETATYPIVVGACTAMRTLLGLPETVPVSIGDGEPLLLTKDSIGRENHIPDIPDDELKIEYTETATEDFDIALTSMSGIANNIWADPELGASIQPLLNRRTLTFNVTYLTKSKSASVTLCSRLRAMNAADSRHIVDNVEYFYYVPDEIIMLLDTINGLKNTYRTTLKDLDVYIADTFLAHTDIMNSETGNPLKLKLVIREREQYVLGVVETDVYELKPEKDDGSNRWSVNIEYTLQYELPNQLVVRYPIAVYNQPMPEAYRLTYTPENVRPGSRTKDSAGLYEIISDAPAYLSIPGHSYYLHLPHQDTFVLPQPQSPYVRIFSVLTLITPASPTHLFYLDELPNVQFHPQVLELIKLEAPRMSDQFASIFNMDIYNCDLRLHSRKVVVTPVTETINGVPTQRIKISTDLPLSITGCYRVGFNIMPELVSLYNSALGMLKANIDTVNASYPGLNVIDNVLGVLTLDPSMLTPGFTVTNSTTSIDIAMHITGTVGYRMFTKMASLTITEMLKLK